MSQLDFIGIGAQKAGTTWLYEALKKHPDISFGIKKELDFFNDKHSFYQHSNINNYEKGLSWYIKQLNLQEGKVNGEITPHYLWDPICAKRIKKDFPNVKIIAILRDPTQRAFSQFNFANQLLHIGSSFERAVKKYPELIERGLYYKQLKRYYDIFDANKIKIIFFEDIKTDPERTLSEIESFLGVKAHIPSDLNKKIRKTKSSKFTSINRLVSTLHHIKKSSFGKWLWKKKLFLKILRKLENIYVSVILTDKELKLKNSSRKKIISYFLKDIPKLEKLTGRDLSAWKN